MKFTKMVRKEFDAKKLHCIIDVRYWEDADVNGVREQKDIFTVPCRVGDSWRPVIDIEKGEILNWTQGITASLYYKVCDAGLYTLLDETDQPITVLKGYVPDMMCPEGGGCGDYIIMNIDENGRIAKWVPNLKAFIEN